MRNLLFEYEKHEEKFLEMNVPRDICKVLIDEQGLTAAKLPESWKFCAAKEEKENINYKNAAGLSDSLVLLSNTDRLLERLHKMKVQELIPLI